MPKASLTSCVHLGQPLPLLPGRMPPITVVYDTLTFSMTQVCQLLKHNTNFLVSRVRKAGLVIRVNNSSGYFLYYSMSFLTIPRISMYVRLLVCIPVPSPTRMFPSIAPTCLLPFINFIPCCRWTYKLLNSWPAWGGGLTLGAVDFVNVIFVRS